MSIFLLNIKNRVGYWKQIVNITRILNIQSEQVIRVPVFVGFESKERISRIAILKEPE